MLRKNIFRSRYLLLAALFFIPMAVYSVTLASGFVGDDIYIVLNNQWITSTSYIPDIFSSSVWSFVSGRPTSNYYRPMMHLVYMAVYPLFATEPWGYHLVNIVIHSINTIMVFYVAEALLTDREEEGDKGGRGSTPVYSFIAAAIFALHPLNSEVVSWIAAVPELSFTFFSLLSLNMYLRAKRPGRGFSWGYYILSAVFFLPALFCKETAIILPAFFVAYDFSTRGFGIIKRLQVYIPFAVLAVGYLVVRGLVLGGIVHHKNIDLPLYLYILNILPIIPRYILKFIVPFPLKASYVFFQKNSFFEPAVIVSFFFSVIYAGAAAALRKNRVVFSCLLWIVIALLPTLYIPVIPGGFAERYFYLPSAAAAVLVAYLLRALLANRAKAAGPVMAVVAAVLVFYGVADARRAMIWKNNITLWGDSIVKTPDNAVAHANLAWAFQKEGDIEGAVREYKEVIRLGTDKVTEALINLGGIYLKQGNYAGAIEALGGALKRTPGNAQLHFNIASAYNNIGQTQSAVRHLKEAIRLRPTDDNAYYNLAWIYQEAGDNAAAAYYYNGAIRLAPDKPDALYNLGIVYERQGDADRAAEAFYRAYTLDPGYKDAGARFKRAMEKRDRGQ